MILEALKTVLEDAELGTFGTDLFVHRMPFDVTKGILLRLPLDGVPINWNLPGYHKPELQAIVRDIDQADGDTLAQQVSDALTIYNRQFLDEDDNPTIKITQLLPITRPIVYPRSEGESLEWSINLHGTFVLSGS